MILILLNYHLKKSNKNGNLEWALTTYLLVFPMVLAIAHLKYLISGKIEDRLKVFFFDALFLVTIPSAVMILLINHILLELNPLSLEGVVIFSLEIIVISLILWFILIKKIKPAFDTDIFPTLCKKLKLFKYKKSEEKPKKKATKKRAYQESNKTKWENDPAFVKYNK